MTRGNQRDKDRERAALRAGGKNKKDDGLTPEQRRERKSLYTITYSESWKKQRLPVNEAKGGPYWFTSQGDVHSLIPSLYKDCLVQLDDESRGLRSQWSSLAGALRLTLLLEGSFGKMGFSTQSICLKLLEHLRSCSRRGK